MPRTIYKLCRGFFSAYIKHERCWGSFPNLGHGGAQENSYGDE